MRLSYLGGDAIGHNEHPGATIRPHLLTAYTLAPIQRISLAERVIVIVRVLIEKTDEILGGDLHGPWTRHAQARSRTTLALVQYPKVGLVLLVSENGLPIVPYVAHRSPTAVAIVPFVHLGLLFQGHITKSI